MERAFPERRRRPTFAWDFADEEAALVAAERGPQARVASATTCQGQMWHMTISMRIMRREGVASMIASITHGVCFWRWTQKTCVARTRVVSQKRANAAEQRTTYAREAENTATPKVAKAGMQRYTLVNLWPPQISLTLALLSGRPTCPKAALKVWRETLETLRKASQSAYAP